MASLYTLLKSSAYTKVVAKCYESFTLFHVRSIYQSINTSVYRCLVTHAHTHIHTYTHTHTGVQKYKELERKRERERVNETRQYAALSISNYSESCNNATEVLPISKG